MLTINNLTIAIVTYNRQKSLEKCLKSILSQKYIPKNVYIVDNDYRKTSEAVYKKYKNINQIKYLVVPKKNRSDARNFSFTKTKTKYLAFIDDDCILSKNWSEIAFKLISGENCNVFFQGAVKNEKSKNKLINTQQRIYQQWMKSNIKNNNFNSIGLDTKNIIFNMDLINIKKIKFDVNLPIFEDVDFGLQLKKNSLKGKFANELIVSHKEIGNLKELIKKYFFRGKVKYLLNEKWGNFDNFSFNWKNFLKDIIRDWNDFYKVILTQTFNLGFFIAEKQKYKFDKNTIYIVNNFDRGANQERSVYLAKFLKENNFKVEILNSQLLFDKKINSKNIFKISPTTCICYRLFRFLNSKFKKIERQQSYYYYLELVLRKKIIENYLDKKKAKIVIIQYPEDILVAKNQKKYEIILDMPTIYSEEIKNKKIRKIEKQIFKQDNNVCFHWYSFLDLSKKLGIRPKNGFILNWGCDQHKKITEYKIGPKVIYLGKLNAEWIYPELLEKIQKESLSELDIYSYESVNNNLYKSIKIKGFMKNVDDVSKYQFGLLSFDKSNLRKNGFSAKHLLYLSYGLPVLCPEWRKDKLLEPATIYYNENNFSQQLKKYSKKTLWIKKHKAALKIAKKMNWSETLKPILPIIYKVQNEI